MTFSTIHTRTILTYDVLMCRKDVVSLIYTERSEVKSWRMPVAHDSRISNGNRTEWSLIDLFTDTAAILN